MKAASGGMMEVELGKVAQEKAKRVTAENKARLIEKYDREGPEGLTDAELEEIIKAGRKRTPEA